MISRNFLILIQLFFYWSCSHLESNGSLQSLQGVRFRKIPVNSLAEARLVIDNHVNYLKLIFEQSRDPYYGNLKWSENCLAENTIGEMKEVGPNLLTVSNLLLSPEGEPGVCMGIESYYILAFCKDSGFVAEMKMSLELVSEVTIDQICD